MHTHANSIILENGSYFVDISQGVSPKDIFDENIDDHYLGLIEWILAAFWILVDDRR